MKLAPISPLQLLSCVLPGIAYMNSWRGRVLNIFPTMQSNPPEPSTVGSHSGLVSKPIWKNNNPPSAYQAANLPPRSVPFGHHWSHPDKENARPPRRLTFSQIPCSPLNTTNMWFNKVYRLFDHISLPLSPLKLRLMWIPLSVVIHS